MHIQAHMMNISNQHGMLIQCSFIVDPPSATMAQHWFLCFLGAEDTSLSVKIIADEECHLYS